MSRPSDTCDAAIAVMTDPLEETDPGRNDDGVASNAEEDANECCGPSFFDEESKCQDLLRRLNEILPVDSDALLPTAAQDPHGVAAMLEQFARILDRYQESPHLLHPYLEGLVDPLVTLLIRYLPSAADAVAMETRICQREVSGQSTTPEGAQRETEGTLIVQDHMLGQDYRMFDADAPKTPLHHVCRALYTVVKTAGEKSCTSYFPNETCHYEDSFYTLRLWKADPARHREWEVRYCLLLWLSNLALVPFPLGIIDTNAVTGNICDLVTPSTSPLGSFPAPSSSLSDAVLATAVSFLSDTSKCREAAALLVARLLTRHDNEMQRGRFFSYAEELLSAGIKQESLKEARALTFLLPGVLLAIARTMKFGQRRELMRYSAGILPCVAELYASCTNDSLLCKTAVKVGQRLLLSQLKRKSAPWKYHRHVTSLATTLGVDQGPGLATADRGASDDEGDAADVEGEGLEEGIDLLLQAIGNKDTVVRWSAAKGIGRVCDRLPQDLAEDVIEAVLEGFGNASNDARWHGGLLTVAELCRRSSLSTKRLEEVVPRITSGLAFDLSKGTYSVGSHVRDAACYACWSIARAYDAVDLEPHVHNLSAGLVVTALFDREVNVRRAAAAAFQECVGRLGNFPNGITLVTAMDFFSLASLKHAYLHVAPQVAAYDAYRPNMLDDLVAVKLVHWDKTVRQCAALALGYIAPREPVVAVESIASELLKRVVDSALAIRHGAVLGLAELVRHLPIETWSEAQRTELVEVLGRIDAAGLFRSRGGEHVRHACCQLVSAFAEKNFPLPKSVTVVRMRGGPIKTSTHDTVQSFLEETWRGILEWLQLEAAATFTAYARAYYVTYHPTFHAKWMRKLLEGCATSSSPLQRRGYLAAIGGVPASLLTAIEEGAEHPFLVPVLAILEKATLVNAEEDPGLQDAEARRNALLSLAQVVTQIPAHHPLLTTELYRGAIRAMLAALCDYSIDKRGDVGSFVRLAALRSLPKVILYGLVTEDSSCQLCSGILLVEVLQGLVKAVTEKLDRVRHAAGEALVALLVHDWAPVSRVLERKEMKGTTLMEVELLRARVEELHTVYRVEWSSPREIIPALAPLLLRECSLVFTEPTLEGLVVSAGDLSAHVAQPAMEALSAALTTEDGPDGSTSPASQISRLSEIFLTLADRYTHVERVILPLCRTVDNLINMGLFAVERHAQVVDVLRVELKHFATTITAILPLVSVLAGLCRSPVGDARRAAWSLALTMIASRYPKVRARMATDLYTALLVLMTAEPIDSDVPIDGCTQAMQHLTATQWDGADATQTRKARNLLYEMLGIAPPSAKLATEERGTVRPMKQPREQVASTYMHLVNEAGY